MAAHKGAPFILTIDGPDRDCYLPDSLEFTSELRYIISNIT